MQTRIAKRTLLQRLVVSGCALAVLSSVGCKTGMSVPGASMLGFKKQPSAETLAGQGPTTTYPVTPSNNFTPNAIASKTAGTGMTAGAGTGQTTVPQGAAAANGYAVAGYNTTGATTPSNPYTATNSAPNYATSGWGGTSAASSTPTAGSSAVPSYAGGSYAGTTPGYNTPTQASIPNYGATPSGYPSGVPSYAGNTTGSTNPYSQPSSYTPPAPSYGTAGGSYAGTSAATAGTSSNPYATPPGGFNYSAPNTTTYPEAQSARVAGGFTMPPSSTTTAAGTSGATGTTGGTAPATFRPGSTAGATSYPSTPYTTPSGSMYR